MFTGIVRPGLVTKKEKKKGTIRLGFRFLGKANGLRPGQSIAVNGVCLTVASLRGSKIEADVVPETLQTTTLGDLRTGTRVNLERSLRMGDEFGGHFVTGHVDGRGEIAKIIRRGTHSLIWIKAAPVLMRGIAVKGSIAVEGVSLTVQEVKGGLFAIALIPHTKRVSNLGKLRAGARVNLERDVISRYLSLFTDVILPKQGKLPTLSLLKRQGF